MAVMNTQTPSIPESLLAKIHKLVRSPSLLIGCDFDGTIAPIASLPTEARPREEAIEALARLAKMPQTDVAVISGRARKDLVRLIDDENLFYLVGSHGGEFDPGFEAGLSAEQKTLREKITKEVLDLVTKKSGLVIEEKPTGVSFHYRTASDQDAAQIIKELIEGPVQRRGVFVRHGKKVIELSVLSDNKGSALQSIRARTGASSVIFFGDDRTDEDAFLTLKPEDLSIKVGDGDTCAEFRISNDYESGQLLKLIADLREEWVNSCVPENIEDYSFLSDQRTVAMLNKRANIVWYCLPRIDSSAVFAELLGGSEAGSFSVFPEKDGGEPVQSYAADGMEVVTEWAGLKVTDYLDCSGGRTGQRAGRSDLIRILEGNSKAVIKFAPRIDFGRVSTRMKLHENGISVEASLDPFVLYAPDVKWKIEAGKLHDTAVGEVDLSSSKKVVMELKYGTGNLSEPLIPEYHRRKQTQSFWESWVSTLVLPQTDQRTTDLLKRSALTIRALCHGPSGAVAAAATTSLPEQLGGIRNWDYRFAWLRDAALSVHSLCELGSFSEAMSFLDWVLNIVDRSTGPGRLRPLYTVTGSTPPAEAEISELAGYAGSSPVRVGNAAAQQIQLDVFGPIVDLIWELLRMGAPLSTSHWRLVEAMTAAVEERWKEPDNGIWEIRGPLQHHIHSKVMCWLTIDRAIALSEKFLGRKNTDWEKLRSEIKEDILQKGWNEKIGSFSGSYGSNTVDASVLFVGLSGLIDGSDKRFISTVAKVEEDLLREDSVYRYHYDDGLPGLEGAFHLCTCWLIQSYLLIGEDQKAVKLFESYSGMAGQTGLIPEEVDIKTKKGLGNHPQAYSHLGFIQSALRLQKKGLL